MSDDYTQTPNTIAALVPCDPATVRHYADCGLLEHRKTPHGMRLFKLSAVEHVRRLRANSLARRGRYPRGGAEAST